MSQQNESNLQDPINWCLSKIREAGLECRSQVDYSGAIIKIRIIDEIMICGFLPIDPNDREIFVNYMIERAKEEQATFQTLDASGRKARQDKINNYLAGGQNDIRDQKD